MAARHQVSTPDRRPTEACRRRSATRGGASPAPVRAFSLDVEGGPEDCPRQEAHCRGTAGASERTEAPSRRTRAASDVRSAAPARTLRRGSRHLGARRADQDHTGQVPVGAIDGDGADLSPSHGEASRVSGTWWRDAECARRDDGAVRRVQSPGSRHRGTDSADRFTLRRVWHRRLSGPRGQLTGSSATSRGIRAPDSRNRGQDAVIWCADWRSTPKQGAGRSPRVAGLRAKAIGPQRNAVVPDRSSIGRRWGGAGPRSSGRGAAVRGP